VTDAEFTQNADLELLRTELDRTQERYYAAAYQQRQAEELLARYLNTLYPVAYAQARARKVSVVAFAEEMFKAISRVQASESAGAEALLSRCLEALFPAEYAQGIQQGTSLQNLAEQLLPQIGPAEKPQPTTDPAPAAVPEPSAPAISTLEADVVNALRFLGASPDWEDGRRRWEKETGKTRETYTRAVDLLVDKKLVTLVRVPSSNRINGYYAPLLVELTPAGRHEYQERMGLPATTIEDFINERYKSPEAWWQIRLTRALIQDGNSLPATFTYEVYDPQDPLPAEFQKRYGNSEPDLIVVMTPHGGKPVQLCIECERALYSSTQLKSKLLKNMTDYAQAGFDGVYYVAPDRDKARLIATAVRKLAADLLERPHVVERGFAAVFTVDDLAGHWLPSPSQINRWFQPRKEGEEAPAIPPEAAMPEHHFKHVFKNKEGKSHAN